MSSFDGLLERAKKNYSDSFSRNFNEPRSGSTQAAVSTPQRTVTTSSFDGLFERAKANYADSFRSDEQRSTVVDWMDRYNRVMQGVSAYDKKRNGGYTQDASGGFGTEIDSLIADFENIKGYAADYGFMNSGNYLDQLKQLQGSIQGINDNFSQFEDEDAYNRYMEYWQDQEEKRNLDLDAYSREIAALEQQLEDYDPQIDWTDTNQRKQYDKGLQELEDEINRRKQYLAQAQRIQKKDNLSAVANPESEKYDAAFESKSGYVSTEQDGKLQRMMSQYSMGYDDLTYEYINNQNGIRDTIKQKAGAYKKGETPFEAKGYDYMTEDEVGLYNYYYSMGGKASAEAYLDTIQEDLNQRKAAGMYQQMEGKTGAELVFGVEAGLDQFKGGIKGAVRAVKGDDSYVAPSATQYASGMVREDLADDGFKLPSWLGGASLGQVGYDAITTTANMAPSIAVGMLNPTLGTAALGVSAGGSAYQEALNEGYSVDQARGYGILSGASEVIMEKVLGGISAYGGNALGKFFTQNMKNADTALKRIAKELGGSMLSEFGEEYLQEVLTPVFKNLTLGTDEEVKLVSAEALYAGFLGAITGGVLEGPSAIANARNATADKTAAVGDKMSATEAVAKNATTTVGVSKMETVQVKPDMDSFAQQFGTQAEAVKRNYLEGQDLQEYEVGFQTAYAMGLEGGRQEALDSVPYLSQSQREIAFSLGRDAAAAQKAAAPKKAAVTAKMTTEEGTQDVTIAEVVDMDDTTMTFRLEDGRTVTDNDLDFETGQLVMSAVWETGMDVKNANAIIKASAANTAADADQAVGIQQAYHYGQRGYTMEQLTKHGTDAAALTDGQRKAAWEAGRQIYLKKSTAPAPALQATKASGVWFDAGGGNVRAFDNADLSGLSSAAVAGARAAQVLQKLGIGKNYYFYESYVNKAGDRVYKDENGDETIAPNGWFDRADGSIHIDLNAGVGGKGLTLYTLSHELTHFVEDWDKQGYRKLSEFLVANYAKRGNVDAMVAAKQAELSSGRGSSVSYEEAYSEFIADSMEAMLSDGNVLEKLQELKKTDDSLFGKIKEFFDNLARKIRAIYKNLTPDSVEGQAVLQMKDQIVEIQKLFAEALVEAGHNFNSAIEQVIQADAEPVTTEEIVTDGAVVTDGNGVRYSIRSMKSDIAEGKMFDDLQTYCNWSKDQVDQLKKDLTELVDYMIPFRDVLDLNETYGREGRRFSPYKPNSDPLYQISMDFSTLCSKRLLTQFVIENLQLRENRPMTAEEQMAIRDMLIEYRKQEKGLQVACAMCYVEAARLKSPKQMQRWLNDPAPLLRDYFGKKNKAFNDSVKKAQADFKESRGYKRDAPKKEMKQADIRELNKIGPRMRGQYQLTAEEAAIVERAMELPNSTYLTAGNLAALSESDPVIYDAYTSFVRTATRSKSLETDEPYYYGDSRRDNGNGIIVSDSFIEAVNRENGMRFSSWSDWRIQHMLDYITAVIDNAVRGAAMHGYTKFPEEVRVLGKTGMMFNLSGVAGTQTGLNEDGSLSFSPTESIDKDEAVKLREDFPETAGLQCIGVGDDHIRELMKSDIIDYIIPYHVSGLNKALRTMADIQGWKDYTGTQHASIDHSVKLQDAADPEHWHEEPVFSEFFVGYDTGMTGIEAMQASAERYRQMCHDRGLIPKFNQFYEKGNNYWKLLIDRKMINQKTGKLIQQKPVTPTFDFNEIKAVVKRHVDNYDSNMEARALNHIVENWDSIPGRIKDLKKGKKKTAPSLKAMNEVANQMLAAQGKETRRFSDRKKPSDNVAREKAPTFYSYMGTVVAGMKQEKFGAASVVNMLRGKGVKAEEIKWSGIEAWLEGKKSVTKAELQEFIAGSMLQIEEEVREETVRYTEEQRAELDALEAENERLWEEVSDLWEKLFKEMVPISIIGSNNFADRIARKIDARGFGGDEDGKRLRNAAYAIEKNDLFIESIAANAKSENKTAKWSEYTIPGGENYREILFRMPESNFSNHAMQSHWDNTSGVIAHARVQDFGDMLFIEEIQSDWHNEGHKQGYADVGTKKQLNDIRQERRTFQDSLRQSKNQLLEDLTAFYKTKRYNTPDKAAASDLSWQGREFFGITQQITKMPEELANRVKAYYSGLDRIREYNRKISSLEYRIDQGVPDAPFRDNYHEFVLKRMIREAAEKGYGRIGWTTADIQSQRWSDEYAEGYRIEYDQDIPKFLNKYGKKWGTKVGRTTLGTGKTDSDGNPRFDGGDYSVEVWSMPITQAMKDSVLYEGQVMYQARATGTSNRDLLAGAFEDLARSPAEMEFLQKYQENIGLLNEQEAKLQEIRTEIRELTFGKGPKDPKRLEKLQEEAGKTANRIHIYDKKLLQLEAAKPLRDVLDREREKVRKATRQKGQEAMAEYREKRKESAARKDAKRKIRKTVMELDKLLNRGDKKKNVKSGMTSMVDSVLKLADALFMDEYTNRDMLRNGVGVELTDAEEKLFREAQQILQQAESGAAIEGMEFTSEVDAMNQLKKMDQKLSSKMAGLKDVFARERKRLYSTTVSDLLGKLADEYSRLSEAEDGAVRASKDENVYAHLLQLQKDVGGTTVRDMTLNQMEAVADAFTMVLTTVRNANKMFAKNLKFKRDALAAMVMGEIGAAVKKISKLIRPGKNAIDSFSWNNLKPVYAFERLGSETLKTLYQNIRSGQDVWSRDMQEADAFRREQYRKHNRKSWNLEKQHRFEFESGIVELSLEQIMSLYAYSRREQALDHLLKGGFVFSGSTEVMVKEHGIQRRYLKKDATAYNLTADELLQVVDTLSKEQKAFVEEMQTYLSDVMGGKGNEISLQMYGIRSYGEKNYFPIRSAGQYMERAKEDSFRKEQGQISIVNSGFTKSTTPKANNPITLDGFMNVWAEHVNDMSMYHGFALPMEDFRRVYNYSSPNMEVGNSQSVNAVIENAFGKAATGYIDQLYKDLNGGAVSDNRENLSKKLVGLHKKAAVFASASVVVQQPSAIVRAFALIDPRHFIGPKVDRKRHKQLWEEVKKYAPVAFVKEMGYFDTGMGRSARDFLQAEEYSGIREKMAALFKDADYRDEILGKAPALADELTWCSIWEAVKRETKAKNPGMDARSDAFLQMAGVRFGEIIDKTQVYDSVLSRSANMRSKALHMNMLTSFLAEPTTSINMLEDALRKGDRQQLKRTVGAVYGSVLLNSLLVSLVYAARDDDEDETYWEKYLGSLAVEMVDGINPITYYPFLRDIWSIGQGFDVERADMSLITDFADAAKKVVQSILKVQQADADEQQAAIGALKDSLWGMTDSIASLTGLPVKNIRRDIEGAMNLIKTIHADLAGRKTTGLSLMDTVLGDVMGSIPIGNLLYSRNKRDRLFDAIQAGDAAYVQRLKAGYKSEDAYHNAIRQALRDNESRIWEAASAWNSGDMDTYLRIAKEVRGEGRFEQDDIVLAIRAEANSMLESENESASTVKGYFTNEKFGVALSQNNTSVADIIRQDLIDSKVANGKTQEEAVKSVESTARSQLKELFDAGSITGDDAEKMLVRYGGFDHEEASDKVADWEFEAEYGFTYSDRGDAYKNGEISADELRSILMDVGGKTREDADLQIQVYDWEAAGYDGATFASVRDYNEYCARYSVPKDIYLHIKKVSNNTKNDVDSNGKTINYSAMKKIMAEIGAQYSLTSVQKYAVARSLGWSEKNIEKYKTW
jgi:hypothetical protein